MKTLRASSRRIAHSETGATITEMMVGIVILAIVVSGTFTVIHGLAKSYTKTSAIETSSAASSVAFLRLEKQVRYASRINTPGTVSPGDGTTDAYVEMLVDKPGPDQCSQWRLDASTDLLQNRQWLDGAAIPTTWATVARGMSNNPAATGQEPFVLVTDQANDTFQRLTVHLLLQSGQGERAVERQTTFIARNSTASAGNVVCAGSDGKAPRS